ncbi:MAG: ATP-binding protein [Thermoplasmata archaeon]|nr:MAG: ATP-binding protein [Thermoplasmata archaeon]
MEKAKISDKLYVLGRREKTGGGALNIGRYYALDGSLGSHVYIDALKPHVVLICGKRGYGKSYTMGTFIEEIASLEEEARKNIGVVVIDTLGIFWTLSQPNKRQEDLIKKWGMDAKNFGIKVFSSEENVNEYRNKGIEAEKLLIRTSELSQHHWAQLFNLATTDYVAAAIGRAVNRAREEKKDFDIDDIIESLEKDDRLREEIKVVAENLLYMAKEWKIFDKNGTSIYDIVRGGRITILDISPFAEELKVVIVAIISRKIFEERVKERRKYEEMLIEGSSERKEEIPITWLAIDEAHVFLPEEECLTKEVLIKQWMRQGRQPGVALILATQRPSSLDAEVLSHSDIIICHRLTAQEDIDALNKVRPTYMQGEIGDAIKRIGTEKGVALILDDTSEAVHIIKIRPRLSWHGGEEPSAMIKND